jgi:hypothetical protein
MALLSREVEHAVVAAPNLGSEVISVIVGLLADRARALGENGKNHSVLPVLAVIFEGQPKPGISLPSGSPCMR